MLAYFLCSVAVIARSALGAQAPYYNSTACLNSETNCTTVCSTIPPADSTNPLCYHGSPSDTNLDYNYDVSNPSDSTPVCATCIEYNYSFFVRYGTLRNILLWYCSCL